MALAEVTPTLPRSLIEARARGAIEVALLSHERDVHVGAGAKRLAAQATTEYHDRFLIELIQNGHDAHPPEDKSGEIAILLRGDEGEFGTLYVANRGRPFSTSNFKTICELGLSDKLPGEAIGNKGLGFKSVLQVCGRPEIYSADPRSPVEPAPRFGGFCFSFATDAELLTLVGGNEGEFKIVRAETAPFHLPVCLDEQPETVTDFSGAGFATVVRLPLDRPGAPTDVRRQTEALSTEAAPLLLFLHRLERLRLEETSGDDKATPLDLRRQGKAVHWPELSPASGEIVDLGPQGQYLCAALAVPAPDVASVIKEAVDNQELEETWLEWRDEAVVTAAVRIDGPEIEHPRLYTFLPMEVEAPFSGHLNAPFYARLDRRDLNRDLAFNDLLLDAGARVCRYAARAIATRDDRRRATAAVDFFSWTSSEATRLQNALGSDNPAVSERVLSVRNAAGRGWASLAETYVWRDEQRRTLTASALAKAADVAILDESLGSRRIESLEALHFALLHRDMSPNPDELSDWVERIAVAQAKGRAPAMSWWNSYYDELADVFEDDGESLEGRKILLDEDGVITATAASDTEKQGSSPTVFFQPVRERAEGVVDIDEADDVRIPKTLRRRMVFVHPGLRWIERSGRTNKKRDARLFLERYDLVKQYSTRSLLEALRDLLRSSRSKDIFRDSLRLAFRLQRTRDYDQRPALRDLGLRVPCRCGWLPAAEAHFSEGWPGTLGDSLERLIELSGGASEELAAVQKTLLLAPEEWPFSVDPIQWADFLVRAGVRDGLWPLGSKTRLKRRGSAFEPHEVAHQLGLPDAQQTAWIEVVEAAGDSPQHVGGAYENRTPFYRLPGQAEYVTLPLHARNEYATLVAASCGTWSDEHFNARVQRTDVVMSSYLDPFSWPTPVAAFLLREQWLPVT
ncbi:MAG: sacsin N-terminal ATP-binding-like domain-containing protein, partial [Solirubrobacteraceae bacterium]